MKATALLLMVLVGFSSLSQENASLKSTIARLDTTTTSDNWSALAREFQSIAFSSPKSWEVHYYAAYCLAMRAAAATNKEAIDDLSDSAEVFLSRADSLKGNASEISALYALIRAIQLRADPMKRYQRLFPEIDKYIASSKLQDPDNPRAWLVEARYIYRVPEAMGGGAVAAKDLVVEAIARYEKFKPVNDLSPRWGERSARQLLNEINNRN